MISPLQLLAIFPLAQQRIDAFIEPLNAALDAAGIGSRVRQAAFLAQIGHESGELAYTRELGTGAQYEGRADLGNKQLGDGVRFKGRGLAVTGQRELSSAEKSRAMRRQREE
jgi:putative chitinase